ncbi:tRNA lysidine(34) synthetase TilS [Spelaeicoccus albus]|uniref:tRNA(Ile)-lysidine synthase n=1 Tax=Spelaeicoccus albus TaxID=1280376 RepID=A0A7Z0D638_9MICO|nr:tRNA lysidine(34) synthetase TilS [Spelaeicoccus albus]NYI69436.1 tRNA(Ile)-lysidine synthase [Spelaeicoccus albus]
MNARRPRLTTEVADIRGAVKASLDDVEARDITVACSGGPDSLILAVETGFVAAKLGKIVRAVIIDHDLQPGSAEVAVRTAATLSARGIDARIERVRVSRTASGIEADARAARYRVLDACPGPVLLGHTQDDQAETVLLGLARGSGTRALAGMRRSRGKYLRPLLGVPRSVVLRAVDAEGLEPWHDPMNDDPAFARVRARRDVLPLMESRLGPGISAALARSAEQCGEDADALDQMADALAARAVTTGEGVEVRAGELAGSPSALRRRVLLGAAVVAGADASALARVHAVGLDRLVGSASGGVAISLPGGLSATRYGDLIGFRRVGGD